MKKIHPTFNKSAVIHAIDSHYHLLVIDDVRLFALFDNTTFFAMPQFTQRQL